MALGFEVQKYSLDSKMGQALFALRGALGPIEAIIAYLGHHPIVNGVDPLVDKGYTADEANTIRTIFGDLDEKLVELEPTFVQARLITGLE